MRCSPWCFQSRFMILGIHWHQWKHAEAIRSFVNAQRIHQFRITGALAGVTCGRKMPIWVTVKCTRQWSDLMRSEELVRKRWHVKCVDGHLESGWRMRDERKISATTWKWHVSLTRCGKLDYEGMATWSGDKENSALDEFWRVHHTGGDGYVPALVNNSAINFSGLQLSITEKREMVCVAIKDFQPISSGQYLPGWPSKNTTHVYK